MSVPSSATFIVLYAVPLGALTTMSCSLLMFRLIETTSNDSLGDWAMAAAAVGCANMTVPIAQDAIIATQTATAAQAPVTPPRRGGLFRSAATRTDKSPRVAIARIGRPASDTCR